MNSIDFQIAAILDSNEKKSYADIAQILGVNEKTVRNRVAQMMEHGIIQHSVLLDTDVFPEVYIAFSAIYGNPNIDIKRISEMPAVLFVTTVTGRYEAMAGIVIKTRKELARFNKQIVTIEGVDHVETFMVIDNMGLRIPAKMLYNLINEDEKNDGLSESNDM